LFEMVNKKRRNRNSFAAIGIRRPFRYKRHGYAFLWRITGRICIGSCVW